MKYLTACAFLLGMAMALLTTACDSTSPVRNSDANAQLDAFFGGDAGGGKDLQTSGKPTHPAISQIAQGNKLLPGTDKPTVDWADPCATNLDELNGALLAYFGVHRAFPPTLDELPKLSPSGAKISLTCPLSGKRYVYHPQGLRPPVMVDQNNQLHVGTILLLYDADPSHEVTLHLTDGQHDYDVKKMVHFGIVMDPQLVPGQAINTYFERVEPNLLNMYLKNAEQSIPVQPIRPAQSAW